MRNIIILILTFISVSCVHLTEEQCRTMNWYNEGTRDAENGKLHRNLDRADKDCQRFKIDIDRNKYYAGYKVGAIRYCTPDASIGAQDGALGLPIDSINGRKPVCELANVSLKVRTYEQGWNKGIVTFCTTANGRNIALEGRSHPNVCPAHLAEAFAIGFQDGRHQYCSQTYNAFILGKNNKGYPEICHPHSFPVFKAEYDKGLAVRNRIISMQNKSRDLQSTMQNRINIYGFINNNGYYNAGANQTAEAMNALKQVNDMSREIQYLDKEIFNLSAM